MPETQEPQSRQSADGFKNVSVSGSSNIAPVMHETLGVVFLGIIALILLFDVRRLTKMLLKSEGKVCGCKCCQGKGCACSGCKCGCDCCKDEKCACGCCKGEEGCDCDCEEHEETGEPEIIGEQAHA